MRTITAEKPAIILAAVIGWLATLTVWLFIISASQSTPYSSTIATAVALVGARLSMAVGWPRELKSLAR
jgi:Ca2+/H+ antiporter